MYTYIVVSLWFLPKNFCKQHARIAQSNYKVLDTNVPVKTMKSNKIIKSRAIWQFGIQEKKGKAEKWNHCKNQVLVYYKKNLILKFLEAFHINNLKPSINEGLKASDYQCISILYYVSTP